MRLRWPIIAAAILAIVAAAYFFLPTEERRIRSRLTALAEALSVPRGEADLARLARAARIRHFFSQDAVVRMAQDESNEVRGRDAIAGLAVRSGALAGGATVEIVRMRVTIAQAGTADVRLEGRIVSHDAAGQKTTLDARMVALTMQKIDGAWVISNARILAVDESLQ